MAEGIRCADHVTPLYPQKLALTSPTGGGRSVGIVRSRTKATEFGDITSDTMVIRLAYDMTQPCFLKGSSHTGDVLGTTCSLLADTMRWRPSLLYRLSISLSQMYGVSQKDRFYSAVLGYVHFSEEANTKLVSFLWNCRMKDRGDTRRDGIGNY